MHGSENSRSHPQGSHPVPQFRISDTIFRVMLADAATPVATKPSPLDIGEGDSRAVVEAAQRAARRGLAGRGA